MDKIDKIVWFQLGMIVMLSIIIMIGGQVGKEEKEKGFYKIVCERDYYPEIIGIGTYDAWEAIQFLMWNRLILDSYDSCEYSKTKEGEPFKIDITVDENGTGGATAGDVSNLTIENRSSQNLII